jgi:hypothetical protein
MIMIMEQEEKGTYNLADNQSRIIAIAVLALSHHIEFLALAAIPFHELDRRPLLECLLTRPQAGARSGVELGGRHRVGDVLVDGKASVVASLDGEALEGNLCGRVGFAEKLFTTDGGCGCGGELNGGEEGSNEGGG